MRCPICNFDNETEARFCSQCGSPLPETENGAEEISTVAVFDGEGVDAESSTVMGDFFANDDVMQEDTPLYEEEQPGMDQELIAWNQQRIVPVSSRSDSGQKGGARSLLLGVVVGLAAVGGLSAGVLGIHSSIRRDAGETREVAQASAAVEGSAAKSSITGSGDSEASDSEGGSARNGGSVFFSGDRSDEKQKESGRSKEETQTPTTVPTSPPTPIPTPTLGPITAKVLNDGEEPQVDGTYRQVNVIAADASSTIVQNGIPNYPSLLFDGDRITSWQEGVDGYGEGEWVSFSFDGIHKVKYMAFCMGNWKTMEYYTGNARPKTITLMLGDQRQQLTFWDTPREQKVQWVEFSRPVSADSVRFTIDEVYPGTSWQDTCIAEIYVYEPVQEEG